MSNKTPTNGEEIFSFQDHVEAWMAICFGPEISKDQIERNHRFLEESLELVQALGCTMSEAHQLVNYTFQRPVGEARQEVGGVMVTLAALCLCHDFNMQACGEVELARVWTKIEQIRAKQAAKPRHSPLPEVTTVPEHIALLCEAYDFGQFANDFNQPLALPIRSALRKLLDDVYQDTYVIPNPNQTKTMNYGQAHCEEIHPLNCGPDGS